MIKELTISGFRGFGVQQAIQFSVPNGEIPGSGLTIITGSNNSGKTTIIEAIRAFNNSGAPSFSEGRRNRKTAYMVYLSLKDENDQVYSIESIPEGGSSTRKSDERFQLGAYILQSRRAFAFEFGKSTSERGYYITNALGMQNQRSPSLEQFEYRIGQIDRNRRDFDPVINRVLGSDFHWALEQRDNGNYYIKYSNGNVSHSGEGVGDGIWSIFTVCAALFDAPEDSIIVIDEPELSVHPACQRKLMELLIEYSRNRQIIISTHSPYFISWRAFVDGASLIRVVKEDADSKCYCVKDESRRTITGILRDLNNPHILGLEANEVFFLNDRIILVEGQEDVVIYRKIATDKGLNFDGEFFGWGVGGAGRMRAFLNLFRDLGYKKVACIFDGDKREIAEQLQREFESYHIEILPEDDIRDKPERNQQAKNGIAFENGALKEEYSDYASSLIQNVNHYLE